MANVIRECLACGAILDGEHGSRKYCEKCSRSPHRVIEQIDMAVTLSKFRMGDAYKVRKVVCSCCKKEFHTTYVGRSYCSVKCRTQHMRLNAKCMWCGDKLYEKGIDTVRGFCSDACRQESRIAKAKADGRYVACVRCGTMHIRRHDESPCCSKECRDAWRAERTAQRRAESEEAKLVAPPKVKKESIKYNSCAYCRSRVPSSNVDQTYCTEKCSSLDKQQQEKVNEVSSKPVSGKPQACERTYAKSGYKLENICVTCRTPQKRCERFTSQFTEFPAGVKHAVLDGNDVVVICPKHS